MSNYERTIKIRVTSKRAEKELKRLTKQMENLNEEADKAGGKFKKSGSTIISVSKDIASAAAAAAAAIIGIAVNAGKSQQELQNLSRQAKMSVSDFKSLSFATSQYGINAEQIADISKDISDKLGEFSKVGTGAFADFADVTGLTKDQAVLLANELQDMPVEDVLLELSRRLEDAGAAAGQTTFSLESLGNDLSKISPLLKENGKELLVLKKRYDDATESLQLTKQEAKDVADLGETFNLLTTQLGDAATSVSATLAPALNKFFNGVIDIVPRATQDIKDFINSLLDPKDIKDLKARGRELARVQTELAEKKAEAIKLDEQAKKQANSASSSLINTAEVRKLALDAEIAKLQERRELIIDTTRKEAEARKKAEEQLNKGKDEKQVKKEVDDKKVEFGSEEDIKKKRIKEFKEQLELQALFDEAMIELKEGAKEKELSLLEKSLIAETDLIKKEDLIRKQLEEEKISEREAAFMIETENILARNNQRMIAISENDSLNYEQKINAEKLFAEQMKEIDQQRKDALEKIQEEEKKQKIQNAIQQTLGALDVFAGGSKKIFKLKKTLALAEAAVSLPQAVIESYKNAGGYPFGVPAALAMAATGIANINKIKNAKFGGGSTASATVSAGGSSGSTGAVGGGDSVATRPDVVQRNLRVESTELTKLRNELNSYNDDDVLPVRFMRKLANSFDETISSGTVTSKTIGGN